MLSSKNGLGSPRCASVLLTALSLVAQSGSFAAAAPKPSAAPKATNKKPAPNLSTLLSEAVQKNNVAAVKALLAKGADPNARNGMGSPAVMVAANRGYLPIVQILLDYKADPEIHSKNKEGGTALLEAVAYDHVAIAKLLLARGANIEVAYGDGLFKGATPLMMASMDPHSAQLFMPMLLEAGANVNAAAADGGTPLHTAASFGTAKMAQLLLDHGATVDARDFLGMTPLMDAVGNEGNSLELVKLLIAKGANVNARGDAAHRAYGRASFMGDTATMHKIEQSGRLNTLHEDDASVLEWAETFKQPKVIELLKQAGAKDVAGAAQSPGW